MARYEVTSYPVEITDNLGNGKYRFRAKLGRNQVMTGECYEVNRESGVPTPVNVVMEIDLGLSTYTFRSPGF